MPNTNADFGYGVNVTTCHSHFVCPEVSKSVISPAGLFFRATSRLLPSTLKALIFLVFPMLRFTVARRCVEDAWRCVGLQWYRTWRANPEEDTTPHTRGTPDPEGEAPKSSRQYRRASRSDKGTAIRVVWQVSAVSVHVTVDSRVPTKAVASLAQAL